MSLAETNEGAAGSVLPRGRHNGAYDRVTPDHEAGKGSPSQAFPSKAAKLRGHSW
jgi:hypothetical protein